MATHRKRSRALPDLPDTSGTETFTLVLENVRCFAHAEVPLGAPVTVIIGKNGSGKTTIAEAIASLVQGKHEGLDTFPLRDGAKSGTIELRGADGESLAKWAHGKGRDTQRERWSRHVFVYGQYRALRPPKRQPPAVGAALLDPAWQRAAARPVPDNLRDALSRPATRSLFDFDEYLFRDLAAYVALLARQGEHDPAARRAWEGLRAWLADEDGPELQSVEIVEQEGRPTAVFRHAGVPLSITELSDGYRAMLAVVIDLVIRYTQIFAALDDPLAGEATVVIDEVDLNLHPRWQRKVIEQLTKLFPRTCFVLTTHSAAVVQAAIDEKLNVVVLEEKRGEPMTARPLKPGTRKGLDGAEIDSVLVSVFGLPSRYSPKYEATEKEAAALRKKVEAGTATEAERRRLLRALDTLQFLLAHEEEREGTGPLMSEIAKTQIAFLETLEAAMPKKGGRRGPAPAKRR